MYTVCCWYPVLTVKLVEGNKYSIPLYSILLKIHAQESRIQPPTIG